MTQGNLIAEDRTYTIIQSEHYALIGVPRLFTATTGVVKREGFSIFHGFYSFHSLTNRAPCTVNDIIVSAHAAWCLSVRNVREYIALSCSE